MNILFVCTGNTCRSPMAEAIFNNHWSEKAKAKSVGMFAIEGENAAEHTVKVLNENGIEIQHKASKLQMDDISWASLILAMTASHKAMLMDQFPGAADKIFTLKEYVNGPGNNIDILDPYGGNIETYRITFNELAALINRIFDKT